MKNRTMDALKANITDEIWKKLLEKVVQTWSYRMRLLRSSLGVYIPKIIFKT